MQAYKLFQLANAYSQSLLAYKTDGSPRPFSASFAVSNRCNIRCSYCNFPNMDLSELDLTQVKTIFGKLKKMGVVRLGLLGGEPLLRKDILKVIALAKEHGFAISMNTNLLLYEKHKDDLDDIDFFYTSLDGSPEKHIANRGKQSYEKILSAIRTIITKGKKVTAICVVTDPDISSADYLLDLAERENILIHFQPECYDTEYTLRSARPDLNQESMREFWRYLLQRKRQGARISSSTVYLKHISEWKDYAVSSYYDEEVTCAAGRGFLFVDSTGHAFPCAYTKGKAEGINLLTEEWNEKFSRKTPCTNCIVGPMLEFNLLFDKPLTAVSNAWSNI